MFSFFKWFRKPTTPNQLEQIKRAIGINIAGNPDFDDYGPPADRLAEKLRGSNVIPVEVKEHVVATAPLYFRNGGSINGYLRSLKEAHSHEPKDVYLEIKHVLLLEVSRAIMLHDLRRQEEAGIKYCTFASAHDERCTPLERKMDGKRLTIKQARRLVLTSSDEISRSRFRAEIKF